MGDELFQAEREHVVGFLSGLREAKSAEDFLQLELRLIGRVRARQKLADEIEDHATELKGQIAELVKHGPKPVPEIQAKQRALELRELQREVSEALRWILRTIGDGLAWRALGYDRRGITVMGRGTRVGRFAEERGFAAEVGLIEEAFNEHGVFALHNDLTTCLRYGDVTVIKPRSEPPYREVEIYEVKAGKLDPNSAQMQRLEKATRLLNQGQVALEGGSVLNAIPVDVPYRTGLAHLRDLIPKARKQGIAAAQINSCHWIRVFYYPYWHGRLDELEASDRAERERLQWPGENEKAFQWLYAAQRMQTRRYNSPSVAPVSIFPFPIEDVADLMMGHVDAMVCLSGAGVEERFAERGLQANVFGPPVSSEKFLEASWLVSETEMQGVTIPADIREQMLVELTTPECLAKLVKAHRQVTASIPPEANEQHVVVASEEAAIWESY